ncbi:hypothetical protein FNF27_00091 [Cafeteria roenbergensis]|uniref:Uncharacterized protein n=1 Tax=Cafeteria roenbergensis TaxID=33653 RepID=A0A5A8DTI0_CAFRO|nr:hypothetical protein FNF29_03454 [Cafeteria roenbergensis]KAA0164278.1 hypothetical protein FNF31_02512 [Cafeteria roenbergensis]KAA0168693.1 hypothetical protein FNF28_02432 [Cafeteria roenbergensis]KAA0178237.1 hypothetical protein FNF27_00091 [Cafeteria roenbergensis]|eukprot:KAA0152930.1 hypothetical protein FNF29_03454 [Cafeteria roenbergensis]
MDDPEALFDGIFDEDDEPADAGPPAPVKAAAGIADAQPVRDSRPVAERQLQAEARCEILERNLSCLFTTARLEIQRKNDEIAHLRAM